MGFGVEGEGGGGRRSEDGGRRAEDRGRKTEVRDQRTEGRRQRAEDIPVEYPLYHLPELQGRLKGTLFTGARPLHIGVGKW